MTPKFPRCDEARGIYCCPPRWLDSSPARQARRPSVSGEYDRDGEAYYGPQGPNRSYQQGPRTRVYVTTRSWLDTGTEVLPGDRKFMDYAFPSPCGYPTFAREKPQPADRPTATLNPPSDLGGFPTYGSAVLSVTSIS